MDDGGRPVGVVDPDPEEVSSPESVAPGKDQGPEKSPSASVK